MPGTELLSGPFTSADAWRAGLPRARLPQMVAAGAVTQVLLGVYLPTTMLNITSARAAAVGLALPTGGALCRRTAAWLHGIDARPPGTHRAPPPLECLVPRGTAPRRRPGVASFASALPSDDICMIEGIPTTTPERTALDLARWSPRFMGLSTLDAFTHAGLVDPVDLDRRLDLIVGQRFVARARDLVHLCERETESAGESWLRLRMTDAGLPRPNVQISLRGPDGAERFRLDSGYEEFRVAAEYDGEAYHRRTAAQMLADEQRRAAILRLFDWTSIGFTGENVLAARPAAERTIAEMIGWTRPLRMRAW